MNMTLGLLGKKIGMTQLFSEEGKVMPCTVIEAGPCVVVQVKNSQTDGYVSVQLGYGNGKRNLNRPMKGHFKKANRQPTRYLREFRISDTAGIEVGQQMTAECFKTGDFLDIAGVTKGKGFQGGVKRWGWAGGGGAHGSMQHREVGSIGSNTTPGRVLRGHHLPGHMGSVRRSVQNLQVLKVDPAQNLLVVAGSVPGSINGLVEIRPAIKNPAAQRKVTALSAKKEKKNEEKKEEKKPEKKEVKK